MILLKWKCARGLKLAEWYTGLNELTNVEKITLSLSKQRGFF